MAQRLAGLIDGFSRFARFEEWLILPSDGNARVGC
jgi:hypothetical protein